MRRPAVSAATLALLAWSLCATAGADDIDEVVRNAIVTAIADALTRAPAAAPSR
jgi:hypothetical protein